MAYDEVIEHQAQERFRAEFPGVVALKIAVESNPLHLVQFAENSTKELLLTSPTEFIGTVHVNPKWNYCANERCYGLQIGLSELCRRLYAPHAGVREFDEHIECSGMEIRRQKTSVERIKNFVGIDKRITFVQDSGKFVVDKKLPRVRCQNTLRIYGYVEFGSLPGNGPHSAR